MKTDTDKALLDKINAAVADHNAAERAVTTAQSELVSKSKVVGQLLLEAKKLHPGKKDFEAFLRRVNGLHISRAYDLLRLAGGRVTDRMLELIERSKKARTSNGRDIDINQSVALTLPIGKHMGNLKPPVPRWYPAL